MAHAGATPSDAGCSRRIGWDCYWTAGVASQDVETTVPDLSAIDCRDPGDCVVGIVYSASPEQSLDIFATNVIAAKPRSRCTTPSHPPLINAP